MYQLKITTEAKKEINKIKKTNLNQAVKNAIQFIKEDPLSGKPLTRELTRQYAYKVGVYRIIYKIDKPNKKVYIITVGHRSVVYS